MPITRTDVGDVAVLRLAEPAGNALGHAFLDAAGRALDDVLASGARALVLTGDRTVFSTGLHLVEAAGYDRAAMARYVDAFDGFFLRVFELPLPVVAAVNGHAIAGGCILMAAADTRIMADGPFGVGVTEVTLGLPFPSGALEVTRAAIAPAAWTDAFLLARRFTPREAAAIGLVHRVVAPDALQGEALAAAQALAAQPRAALAAAKEQLRAPVVSRIRETYDAAKERFLEAWFSDDARGARDAVLADLRKKKGS